MVHTWRRIWAMLDGRERRRAVLVVAVFVLVALAETIGVASVVPFIGVLADPSVVESNPYLALAYDGLGFSSTDRFLVFLGLGFFAVLVGSLLLRAVGAWVQLRFSHNRNWTWGSRLIGGYLRQPYEWFLNRHSSELGSAVLAEVNQVTNGVLLPSMQLMAQALVAVFLLALLIAVDPLLSLMVACVLGGGYSAIAWVLKRKLESIGVDRTEAIRARFHLVNEAFGSVKDVKVNGLEEVFVRRFIVPSQVLADRQIVSGLIAELPSFIMQGLLFGGMLLVLLYLMVSEGGFEKAVPIATLFAFAGYRLMPALQNIYRSISEMRYNDPALESLFKDLSTLDTEPASAADATPQIHLRESLELRGATYSYPDAETPALDAISLRIEAHTSVGLVGPTGCGKTTALDLILGLIRPRRGSICVDGKEIERADVRAWQRSIGYVPQTIFLSDETIAGNIAFGVPPDLLDMASVKRAATAARLHDFIENELPDGYATEVGERGVRLSGGQRQRIGIARALYHDPDVLILDEATSALDSVTERSVMDAIASLGGSKTIITVAHRLSTIRNCDRIFVLNRGKLIAQGSYDELAISSAPFRELVEAS